MLTTGFQPCLQFCKFRAAYPNLIGIHLLYHNFAAKIAAPNRRPTHFKCAIKRLLIRRNKYIPVFQYICIIQVD